ncbi:MAG TPA: hypothetical protein V6C72_14440 [Chroococcales cyanobacterium]
MTRFRSPQSRKMQLVALLALLTVTRATGYGKETLEIRVLSHTQYTDQALAYLRKGISTIPATVQSVIAAHGITVTLTPRLIFDEPESSGHKVFRQGGTTDNVGGMFEPNHSRVLIPECASWRNSPPRPQGSYITSVVRHELGHAFDHSLGNFSNTPAFKQAYNEDLQRLSNEQMRAFTYYITGTSSADANTPTDSGRHELFASIFGNLCTPVKEKKSKGTQLLDAFPHVARLLTSLDRAFESPPEYETSSSNSRERLSDRTGQARPTVTVSPEAVAESSRLLEQALEQLNNQHYAKAVWLSSQSLERNPAGQRAYLVRGNAYVWLKKYRAAVSDYTQYIKFHPADADAFELRSRAYGWLGQALLQQKDEAKARQLKYEQ